jgi:hypothetical protein
MSSYIINEDGTVTENRRGETAPTVNPDSVCGQIQVPSEESTQLPEGE